ncbi:MAG: lysophospholipid acyltransferase family protein [bacterium]
MPNGSWYHRVEAALARTAFRVVPRLSRRAVLRLSRFCGAAACLFSRHLRHVGLVNLDIAYGDTLSADEKHRILRSSFQSFALMLLDTFWFARDHGERIKALVRFAPEFDQLFRPAAQICVTGHLGNWEVLGLAFAMRGFPLVSVAAPLENPLVDDLFNELRKTTGQQVVSKHGALRPLLRALKDNGKIALLLDQNTKPADGGVFVDFFGKQAPVSSAAAMLAKRTDAAIFVGACLAQPDGTYFAPAPVRIAVNGDETTITQRIAAGLEELVRAHPEHWLWTYKRWKYVAPGQRRGEYPFYAKELV